MNVLVRIYEIGDSASGRYERDELTFDLILEIDAINLTRQGHREEPVRTG